MIGEILTGILAWIGALAVLITITAVLWIEGVGYWADRKRRETPPALRATSPKAGGARGLTGNKEYDYEEGVIYR